MAESNESLRGIFCADRLVGIADAADGRRAYLYLYLFPQFRRRGYGAAAAEQLEAQLSGAERIQTCFRADDSSVERFAAAREYKTEYASDYMVYSGPSFGERAAVREYRDEDYPAVHAFCAQAFHLMRLGTGCFPDSIPEPPSREMRACWAETAGERLVYELGGEIVGYAHTEGDMLDTVAVVPERQGEGIGRKLVRYAVDRILEAGYREAGLYCVVGNPAKRLYERLGFQTVYRNKYAVKRR